ncbi:MAG: hypothetical protein K0S61_4303, partial [Anaerocolumna sp.]|nr:hypothetical protein [Anaerocolumna sp.]
SIRFKLTLTLTAIMIGTIFTLWFLNRTLLSEYYLNSKEVMLGNTFKDISAVFTNAKDPSNLSAEDNLKLERYVENRNVSIYILSKDKIFDGMEWLNALDNSGFPNTRYLSVRETLKRYIFNYEKQELVSNKEYDILKTYDARLDLNYVELIGSLDGGNSIYVRTNLESIHESVLVANDFLTKVGLAALIISSIIMFYISKKFSKPILQLSGIAKQMSDLNFDVKYNVNTRDEIGELGSSINILSEKLENTISELKTANNELLSDIQNKVQIDEMRKDFLSNVTHELKTPIALIQGYAEGLKDNINDDMESKEFYCEVIIDEAQKMNAMVKKLLSLNQIESGYNQVNIERFDITALIKSVLGSTEILMEQKQVILHFDQINPVYVWADEYMIEEVVTNYISNALNHVDGARIIEVKLIRSEKVLRVAVFNTGANIPDEDLDNIWIKFYKVDKARTREYGGSGIGLSIVKAIMDSHNQKCGVLNHEKGVEFWFELDTELG